jgi:sucrose-6-phosphate hydrolase SacC (GH32 family)
MSSNMASMTLLEIIEASGGPQAISDASQISRKPISVWAIYRWQTRGIPEQHWPLLMTLVRELTVEEIYRANVPVRRGLRVRPLARVDLLVA